MVQPTDPTAGGFGLPTGGYTPYGALEALLPYLTFGPTTALSLAQLQGNNAADIYRAQVSAAGQQGANAAQIAAAQIAARGGLAQQNVQSGTNASVANANNAAMLIAAAGGDKNAIARLNAQNQLAAAMANQQAQQKTLGLLASTGLRDQLQARAFTRGFAPQAAFGSALTAANVGPLQQVTAPTAQFQAYDPMTQFASAPSGNLDLSGINMNTGGGIPAAPNFDMGSLFSGYNSMLGNLFGNFGINFGESNPLINPIGTPGPTGPTTTPTVGSQLSPIVQPPALAKGGTLDKRGALVGERGPEAIVFQGGKYHVIPLTPMQTGGTLPKYGNLGGDTGGTSSIQPIGEMQFEPPPLLTGGVPASAPAERTDAGGGTSPTVDIRPDGTIKIGGSVNPFAPSTNATGREIQSLPAYRAMFGQNVSSYPGTQTFDLPEYGLSGLKGPAQLARLLGQASPIGLDDQQDLLTLLREGGYSLPAIGNIVNAFTPGYRQGARSVGF